MCLFEAICLLEQNTTQVSNVELLARIQTLEDMLCGRNNDLSSHAAAPQGCLTPMTLGTNARRYQSHSGESTTVPALSSLSPSALIGALHVSKTGHVRYHPGAS